MYKCQKCGKIFNEMPSDMIRCPSCANKIFLKQRQSVARKIKAE